MGDPYDIGDHGKGIPLGHTLLVVKELSGPIYIAHHQIVPVAIALEGELRATSPIESNGPQHCCKIFFIECILRINEE